VTGRSRSRRDRSRGQSLVEFSVLVPAFMLILFGMLEFGFVFTHNLTLEYATREGARTGAALADGGNNAAVCATIDPQIIAAVERVLTSPGSPIDENHITFIKIWKNDPATFGVPLAGTISTWTYLAGAGPVVDGKPLDFVPSGPAPWAPCSRNNGSNPDSIGVSLAYNYSMVTPLASVRSFFGGGVGSAIIPMGDRTVMALNP
jgi:hypothetical protein